MFKTWSDQQRQVADEINFDLRRWVGAFRWIPTDDMELEGIIDRIIGHMASLGEHPNGETKITNPNTGGSKGQKIERMDLLPFKELMEVSRLYGRGAQKYEDRNWEKGYAWSLSIGALFRHFAAFASGEDLDEEMGECHLSAVVFHALALMQFRRTHPELDDRAKGEPQEAPQEAWDDYLQGEPG